jgi:type II secretory pathway predicted ATPase ExeA/phage tail protein X
MYLKYYGLKKQPFHITPDPEFLYLSPSHKEAMSAIIYGIAQKKGFIAITGAVGVGKTTILRSYLETVEKKHLKLVYVFNPQLTFKELIKTIYQELGLETGRGGVLEMVNKLNVILIEEYKQGNTVVLIIDEVQNMPIDTLESLRMLSNLETSKDKLIQIVLVGQPEFKATLDLDRLRQLKQRLVIRSTIQALTKTESLEYLKFRLKMAGGNPDSVFSAPALKKIINKAQGIPRTLNILSDNALVTGFGYQQRPVTTKIVREIIRDLDGTQRSSLTRRWVPAVLILSFLVLVAGFGWSYRTELFHKIGILFSLSQDETIKPTLPEINAKILPKVNTQQRPPEERLQVKAQQPLTVSKQETLPMKKIVVRGDTLSKLANEVYGKSDGEVLILVRGKNPQIADPNLIHTGSTIIFPDLPKQGPSGSR